MSKKRYPPRVPRHGNGFRAQSLRALPRGAWWVKRWLQAIEEMRLGARAGRGRVYAEQGQVTMLEVDGGHVEAKVLGARPEPYTVKIDFEQLTPPDDGGLDLMSMGRILAGEMPSSLEEMFSKAGRSPYPTPGADRFWCSCPDWSKPCKHIAAVLYQLGDVLVREPALLLRLRGLPLPKGAIASALPLWKGETRLDDALGKIYRRTGFGG